MIIAMVLAAGRLVIGLALLASPALAGTRWLGPEVGSGGPAVGIRALGIRDAAIGAGLIATALLDQSILIWLLAGLASDLVDMVATGLAGDAIARPARLGTVALAGGSSIAGLVLALSLPMPV
ncbi:MAG: hypothetical protein QOG62_112 [Thermoleophilaceae bacterium]|nr:hypothetical protein [Thermoleophilaceae bacterium]